MDEEQVEKLPGWSVELDGKPMTWAQWSAIVKAGRRAGAAASVREVPLALFDIASGLTAEESQDLHRRLTKYGVRHAVHQHGVA